MSSSPVKASLGVLDVRGVQPNVLALPFVVGERPFVLDVQCFVGAGRGRVEKLLQGLVPRIWRRPQRPLGA